MLPTSILKWHLYLYLLVISHLSNKWFIISILSLTVLMLTLTVIFFLFLQFLFSAESSAKYVRKHCPYNDTIRSQSQQLKYQFTNLLVQINNVPFGGNSGTGHSNNQFSYNKDAIILWWLQSRPAGDRFIFFLRNIYTNQIYEQATTVYICAYNEIYGCWSSHQTFKNG